MNQTLRANSRDLLTCFFEESEKLFRFLEDKHGFLFLSGLAKYKKNYKVIVPYHNHAIENPFLAITRYEQGEHAIEIVYGEDNYTLDVYIYPDYIQRLHLKDLLRAIRSNEEFDQQNVWLTEQDLINRGLEAYADICKQHGRKILHPTKKLIDRALTMRGKLVEQTIRRFFEESKMEACKNAARAFVQKDYSKVIDVLEPYEGYLEKSDLKKLHIAREKLHS